MLEYANTHLFTHTHTYTHARRALREAVLRQATEAGKPVDDSKYKGMNNYIDYRAGFRWAGAWSLLLPALERAVDSEHLFCRAFDSTCVETGWARAGQLGLFD